MAFSLFGGNKNKKKNSKKKENSTETPLLTDENADMQWFDDIVDGSLSDKGDKQILTKLWKQISGENMISRLRTPRQRTAATLWGKLCHRCDISYPSSNKLKPINMLSFKNKINELKYAVRHAIAAYPPMFICFMGLKADVAYALKSNKKILKSAFKIEEKDVIVDNCSSNLILLNSTHQPAFYLCVDHKQSKIIVSIRGSSSLADALTDVNAVSKQYSAYGIDGCVHEGIMAATRFVFDKVTNKLVDTCHKYKNYQLIITGHSLGAGVAACLGFMYRNHPVIHKQNDLKVYAFASPPVVSKAFVDNKIGEDYIISVALTTDLVTRLSLESMKKQNCRLDMLMSCDKNTIKNLMIDLNDIDETDIDETEGKEDNETDTLKLECSFVKYEHNTYTFELKDNDNTWNVVKSYNEFNKLNNILQAVICTKDIQLPQFPAKQKSPQIMQQLTTYVQYLVSNKDILALAVIRNFLDIPVPMKQSLKLIKMLKETETPHPQDELFPLGKILWFVPKCCMTNNVVERRKVLMCIKDCDNKEANINDEGNETKKKDKKKQKYKTRRARNLSGVFSNTWHNLAQGFKEFQDVMDNPLIAGGAKLAKKYDGSHYVLCEATDCRQVFQDMVLDIPESLASHMPNRYIWALNAHLTRGNLYDEKDCEIDNKSSDDNESSSDESSDDNNKQQKQTDPGANLMADLLGMGGLEAPLTMAFDSNKGEGLEMNVGFRRENNQAVMIVQVNNKMNAADISGIDIKLDKNYLGIQATLQTVPLNGNISPNQSKTVHLNLGLLEEPIPKNPLDLTVQMAVRSTRSNAAKPTVTMFETRIPAQLFFDSHNTNILCEKNSFLSEWKSIANGEEEAQTIKKCKNCDIQIVKNIFLSNHCVFVADRTIPNGGVSIYFITRLRNIAMLLEISVGNDGACRVVVKSKNKYLSYVTCQTVIKLANE